MALKDSLNPWAPKVLSILRIMAGLIFLAHGTGKHLGWPVLGFEVPAGSPGWWAGWIELVCGVLIALGLFTRPAAFLASGTMAVAYFIAHAPGGLFVPAVNGGDAAILYCFVFLYLVFRGPGPWSLDAKMGRDS